MQVVYLNIQSYMRGKGRKRLDLIVTSMVSASQMLLKRLILRFGPLVGRSETLGGAAQSK